MENRPDIKIVISCHKESVVPDNPLLLPVQVGAALSARRLPIRGDDEGENISAKNRRYCELTAQYWAWKNLDADYYGFFHYRRYFSFSSRRLHKNIAGEVRMDAPDENAVRECALDEKTMRDVIGQYDLIIPELRPSVQNYLQYSFPVAQNIEDLRFCIRVIDEDFPEMSACAHRFLRKTKSYFCNMFIMKKELFFPYCEWLFHILERHEKQFPCDDYDVQAYRVSGYLAERLCAIYLFWLQQRKDIKVKALQTVVFDRTDPFRLPAVNEKEHNYVLPVNRETAAKASVLIRTLSAHVKTASCLTLLSRGLPADILSKLKREAEGSLLRVNGYDMGAFLLKYSPAPDERCWSLLAPELFPSLDRVIALSADTIAAGDPEPLWDALPENALFAGVTDVETACALGGADRKNAKALERAFGTRKCFLAEGVLALALRPLSEISVAERLSAAQKFARTQTPLRNALHLIAGERFSHLPLCCNLSFDSEGYRRRRLYSFAPHALHDEWLAARNAPRFVRFDGAYPPWERADCDFGDLFWHYARKTAFYEVLLAELFSQHKHSAKQKKLERRRARFEKKYPVGSLKRLAVITATKKYDI